MEGVACALRAAADEMTRALAEGFTLVLGGDCTLAAGVAAGARRYLGQPPGLVFIDADADLNTPETTPSGFLHGMALPRPGSGTVRGGGGVGSRRSASRPTMSRSWAFVPSTRANGAGSAT